MAGILQRIDTPDVVYVNGIGLTYTDWRLESERWERAGVLPSVAGRIAWRALVAACLGQRAAS